MMQKLFLIIFIWFSAAKDTVLCQEYNIVIKGGHVIDPKNKIDALMDVAITDSRIVQVAANIDPKGARQVVNAKGMYVTPGIIDMHSHNFPEVRKGDPFPDGFTFRNGVTTTVDAGSSGWRTFPMFKEETIDHSEPRVLAWLNIVGDGFKNFMNEQNTGDMDSKLTANMAKRYREYIIGVKVAHFEGPEWTPVDRAVEAGNRAGGIPVMIDFGGSNPPLSIQELFTKHLRPGDIFTHCFGQLGSREFIVDTLTGKVKPFVLEARKKGIIFDVGYGGISFAYSQAIPAMKDGFFPNSISTDMNHTSTNGAMKDILSVMSKFMTMGMTLPNVIQAVTMNPARQIKHEELGSLTVGSEADVAILTIREGNFGFYDYTGYKMEGKKKFECEMTIRAGKIVYDLNGIANPVIVTRRVQSSSTIR